MFLAVCVYDCTYACWITACVYVYVFVCLLIDCFAYILAVFVAVHQSPTSLALLIRRVKLILNSLADVSPVAHN